jgi:hypothetical protein
VFILDAFEPLVFMVLAFFWFAAVFMLRIRPMPFSVSEMSNEFMALAISTDGTGDKND